jgi:uncharacterized membrane protein YwzB
MSEDGNSSGWMCEGSDKDVSDNDNNYDSDQNDHNVVERGNNDPNLLGSIFGEDDSDDDNNDNEGEAAPKLLDKKYVMKNTIMDGQGRNIEVKCTFLVIRNDNASKDEGVLMTFLGWNSFRNLCKSLLKAGNDTKIAKNNFARLVQQFVLSPILEIPVKNKSKAPTNLIMLSVQDVINYICANFLLPYVKKSDNVKSMMSELEKLNNPSLLSSCSQQIHHENDPLNTLTVDGIKIRKLNFLIKELP